MTPPQRAQDLLRTIEIMIAGKCINGEAAEAASKAIALWHLQELARAAHKFDKDKYYQVRDEINKMG